LRQMGWVGKKYTFREKTIGWRRGQVGKAKE